MSQKINPISFRLGLFQVWNTTITTYGKKIDFSNLYQKNILEKYLKVLFIKNNLYLGNISWFITPKNTFSIIAYTESSKLIVSTKTLISKLNTVFTKMFEVSSYIYLIKHSSWCSSTELIKSYILFNINQDVPFKNIFKNTSKIISSQLSTKKILYTVKGPLSLKLKGFKFKLSGRFDNSRNQMTKSMKYTKGALPIPSINTYVEYSQTSIYTKLGTCGLHIWIIYVN